MTENIRYWIKNKIRGIETLWQAAMFALACSLANGINTNLLLCNNQMLYKRRQKLERRMASELSMGFHVFK